MSGDHPLDMPTRRFPRAAGLGQTDTFFPSNIEELFDRAKAICAMCPEMHPCREASMAESYGVWGGLSPQERRRRAGFAEDVPPPQPRKRIRSAPMQPCGTRAAAIRHRLAGETPCEPCRIADAEYQRAYRGEYRKRNKGAS